MVEHLLKNSDKGFTLHDVDTHGKFGLVDSINHNRVSMVELLLKYADPSFVLNSMIIHSKGVYVDETEEK